MNATADTRSMASDALGRPVSPPRPQSPDLCRAAPRLPVWDERARKMGFPPSAR